MPHAATRSPDALIGVQDLRERASPHSAHA
jgi:hypothetical protein